MTLQELGLMLRQEREARGFSLDMVATSIKVSARTLRAIEQGDTDELPHAVYARGFIRAYGNLLGVAPDVVTDAIDSVYPFEVQEDLVENPCVVEPVSGRGRRKGVVLTLALITSGLLFAGYWYHKQKTAREQMPAVAESAPFVEPAPPAQPAVTPQTAAPAASAPDVVQGQQADPSAAGQPSFPADKPQQSGASSSMGAATGGAASERLHNTPTPEQVAREVLVPQSASDAAALPPAGQHRIVLTAVAECWVHSTADGSDVRQFSLHKGETFALTFSKKLTLKLGNAGGVRIRFDGNDMPAPGEAGQVKTLTFPADE